MYYKYKYACAKLSRPHAGFIQSMWAACLAAPAFVLGFRLSKSYTVTAIVKLLRCNDKGAATDGMDTAASPIALG